MPPPSTVDPDHGVASATGAAVVPSTPWTGCGGVEDFPSSLRTQAELDALCRKHAVPKGFTAHLAGDLRANSTPPPGAICVYAPALEAGMPVPLRGFFSEALAHFGIAPAQLTPNGWRIMTAFVELGRSEGVPPSLAVFRRFFLLPVVSKRQTKGWYCFRSRDSSGLRFAGMPVQSSIWKRDFFFLSSPEPWPCPVDWGEPPKSSSKNPVLTGEDKKSAAKLLRAHGGAALDLRKYLCNSNLAAAMTSTALALLPPLPAPSSSTCTTSSPKGMLTEKAAAQASASAKKVKAEPGTKAAGSPSLCGKKRRLEEPNGKERAPPSMLITALSSGNCSSPPGFYRKRQRFPSRNDGDGKDWVVTREQLEATKSELSSAMREAEQEQEKAQLAAAEAELARAGAGIAVAEAEVVKAKAELTAAKRAAGAADQEKTRPEVAMKVAKAMAKLAVAKRALEEELESAKAAALQQLLCCEEHVRRRAEHALQGYRCWRAGRAA